MMMVMAATTATVGGAGTMRMSQLSQAAQQVYTDGTVPLAQLEDQRAEWWTGRTHNARTGIAGLPSEVVAAETQAQTESDQRLATGQEVLDGTDLAPGAARQYATYKSAAQAYFASVDQVGQRTAAGDQAGALAVPGQHVGSSASA